MHQQWETVTDKDLTCLESVARAQPEASSGRDWFLLWVPLRRQSHVPRSGERPMAAIIERYPGENPAEDLDFFSDPRTDQRIGGLLAASEEPEAGDGLPGRTCVNRSR
jgi:hypothetical protein